MLEKMETDYLVVGTGAVGMAFVDTLLDESNANIIMVDNHHQPGGHWNDAYSFVRLHQPSHFYGVASTPLGSMRIDETGVNKGYFELATGNEVQSYFEKVMRERFLPSGRVRYFPMCEWQSSEAGITRFTNSLSGKKYEVSVSQKVVDTTYFNTTVPSRHKRAYDVADGVACVTPNQLPLAAEKFDSYCIVGAGKTAMDVGIWLLGSGAQPDAISWVCPRHSWLLNREVVQGHEKFFFESMNCITEQLAAIARAKDVDQLFKDLEACGFLLRIHRDRTPSMFHYAVISKGEVEQLRKISKLIENGRVSAIEQEQLLMQDGSRVPMPANTLYIDCTASAVNFIDSKLKPIFEPGLITPQATQVPNPCFSAAMAAFVEANYPNDEARNKACRPIPLPDNPTGWLTSQLGNMMNQGAFNRDPILKKWVASCRLDAFGRVSRGVKPYHLKKIAVLTRLRKNIKPAVVNLKQLIDKYNTAA